MINVKTRQVKLIDFGSLTELQRGVHIKSFYGTKKFSSPEALGGLYSPELQEVWALGSLYYVLLFKMDPFKNDDEVLSLDIGKRIERILTYGINGKMLDISEASVQSIRLMLEKDWGRRPRVDQLPDLPIFSS
jgi:serine/threonine protein kinase